MRAAGALNRARRSRSPAPGARWTAGRCRRSRCRDRQARPPPISVAAGPLTPASWPSGLGAGLEGLEDRRARPAAPAARLSGLTRTSRDAGRDAERVRRLVLQRRHHEVAEDRRGEWPPVSLRPSVRGLSKPTIDADREIGREAHEPGVVAVVGRAGLAGERLADGLDRACRCRAGPRPPSSRRSG